MSGNNGLVTVFIWGIVRAVLGGFAGAITTAILAEAWGEYIGWRAKTSKEWKKWTRYQVIGCIFVIVIFFDIFTIPTSAMWPSSGCLLLHGRSTHRFLVCSFISFILFSHIAFRGSYMGAFITCSVPNIVWFVDHIPSCRMGCVCLCSCK